jgi:hypothetical protein
MTPDERYLNDPTFKSVVDMLQGLIMQYELTPSEIRLAAMMAAIRAEERTVRRFVVPASPELHDLLHELHIKIKQEQKNEIY